MKFGEIEVVNKFSVGVGAGTGTGKGDGGDILKGVVKKRGKVGVRGKKAPPRSAAVVGDGVDDVALGDGLGERLGERLGETEKRILTLIAGNKVISIPAMAKNLNISTTAVEKHLKKLKSKGAIVRVGSARGGAWRINGEIDFDNGGNMNKTRH